jgi:hypothetical protein
VNVAGLMGAGDVIGALRAAGPDGLVVLPRTSLDYFGRHFLDDGTPADVMRALNRPALFASFWSDLLDGVLDFQESGTVEAPGPGSAPNGRFWSVG